MKTLLLITAQVHENYGSKDAPHWKPKMGQVFSLNVEADAFMYAQKECINAIGKLLDKNSNEGCKFTYVSHELIFQGIDVLNDEDFEAELLKECEKTQG